MTLNPESELEKFNSMLLKYLPKRVPFQRVYKVHFLDTVKLV